MKCVFHSIYGFSLSNTRLFMLICVTVQLSLAPSGATATTYKPAIVKYNERENIYKIKTKLTYRFG